MKQVHALLRGGGAGTHASKVHVQDDPSASRPLPLAPLRGLGGSGSSSGSRTAGPGSSPSLLSSTGGALRSPVASPRRVSGRVGPIESMRERVSPVHMASSHVSPKAALGHFNVKSGLAHRLPTMKKFLGVGGDDSSARSSEKRLGLHASNRRIRRREFHFVPTEPTPDKLRKMRYVIMPRSNWKVRWDLWIGFIICYSVIMVPYRIGFAVELMAWEQGLNFAFDASFATDVVFNFFTGFFDEDVFVADLPKIRWRYIKSWFVFDLLSTLPMDQLFQAVTEPSDPSLLSFKLFRTMRLVRLLKLMRLLRLKRAVDTIQMDALNAHVLQTAKSLGMIILVIHLVSCAWFMFYTWDPAGVNWVTHMNPAGIENPYLVCFYWVSNTMMSVGYGDIYGITDGERLFSIFVECLGSVSVGLIIANIQMLTENYNPRGVKMKQKLNETKEFLLKRCIPRRMRQRVISQFEYHWSHRTVFDEDQILHHFPKSLQYEILAASMESFVKKFPFFGMTTVEFFAFTIPRLRPIVVGPRQTLVEAESVWEELYFVVSGSLDAMRGNVVASTLSGGDICGIEYLLGPRRRYVHTYVSTSKTELFAIYSSDLVEGMESCAVATKYLRDLSHIISERYADAARRGRKTMHRRESSSRRASIQLFLQYRNRKSTSYNHILHAAGLDDVKSYTLAVSDDARLHWSIIRHYSRMRLLWDAVMGVVVGWTAISVPFRISFNIADSSFLLITDRLSDVLFLVDIVLNFFTTYLDETGVEIVDRHEIRKHYLKRSFSIDVISSIPFDFVVELITASEDFRSLKLIRTVKLVKLLRLVRIMKIFKLNSQRLSELDVSMDSVRLLKLLAPVLTIAHYVGCFWFYLSADNEAKDAWWGRVHFDDPTSVTSRYIASVYWATTTMATVGFGDIYAVNSHEQLFSTFVMIGGTTLFAYVVGTVIEVVSNSKSLMNREHELGQHVNAYIKERGVSSDFALACQEHLRYLNTEKTLFDEQGLFDALSHAMRSELILYLNGNVLSQIRFFDKKPKWFLTLLLPRLVPQYFLQGDLLIYHANLVNGIFFLMSGTAMVRLPQVPTDDHSEPRSHTHAAATLNSEPGIKPPRVVSISTNGRTADAVADDFGTVATLHEGEFFGYKEVLTRSVAQYNVFACVATGTYMLPSESLDFISDMYPDVLEEMRRFFLHAITKQQTILQHWHNNELMGISSDERNQILRNPNHAKRKADTSSFVLPGVQEDPEAETSAAPRGDQPLEPPHQVVASPRRSSIGDLIRSASRLYRRNSASDGSTTTNNDLPGDEPNNRPASAKAVLEIQNGGPTPDTGTGPRTSFMEPTGDMTCETIPSHEESFRVQSLGGARHGSVRMDGSLVAMENPSDTFFEKAVQPLLRRNHAHARRSSLVVPQRSGAPPPLLRYPSMPEEVCALVSKLLEVEGYVRPGTREQSEGKEDEGHGQEQDHLETKEQESQ